MTDKGVLRFEGERPRLYYPGIQKEDAAFSETQQLLSRAFGGPVRVWPEGDAQGGIHYLAAAGS